MKVVFWQILVALKAKAFLNINARSRKEKRCVQIQSPSWFSYDPLPGSVVMESFIALYGKMCSSQSFLVLLRKGTSQIHILSEEVALVRGIPFTAFTSEILMATGPFRL